MGFGACELCHNVRRNPAAAAAGWAEAAARSAADWATEVHRRTFHPDRWTSERGTENAIRAAATAVREAATAATDAEAAAHLLPIPFTPCDFCGAVCCDEWLVARDALGQIQLPLPSDIVAAVRAARLGEPMP